MAHTFFTNYVVEEYIKSTVVEDEAREGDLDVEVIAKKRAVNALADSRINLLITPDSPYGSPSNLFIANHAYSRFSAPFTADGPWQLARDRTTLEMDSQNNTRSWDVSTTSVELSAGWAIPTGHHSAFKGKGTFRFDFCFLAR